jgi:hypothetical protein
MDHKHKLGSEEDLLITNISTIIKELYHFENMLENRILKLLCQYKLKRWKM